MLQDCDLSGNVSAPFLFFPTRARPCVAALLVEYAIARKVNIASSTSLSGFLESYHCVEDYMSVLTVAYGRHNRVSAIRHNMLLCAKPHQGFKSCTDGCTHSAVEITQRTRLNETKNRLSVQPDPAKNA